MLHVRCLHFSILFCVRQISCRSQDCHRIEVSLSTFNFGDVARFNTVVFICLLWNFFHKFLCRLMLEPVCMFSGTVSIFLSLVVCNYYSGIGYRYVVLLCNIYD